MGARVAAAGLGVAVALPRAAPAVEPTRASAEIGGDVKSFFVATFPYDGLLVPDDPAGLAILSLRFRSRAEVGTERRSLAAVAHVAGLATTPGTAGRTATLGAVDLAGSGAAGPPELVDLSWSLDGGEDLAWTARPDRLYLRGEVPHLRVTVGRQPVSFGHGLLFTPLDLVAPFRPTTLDQEYKPGTDAVRLDAFAGMAGRLTLVGAWAGSWDRDGLVGVACVQDTVGAWDLGVMLGSVRGDGVLGVTATGSAGPLALRAEGTLTLPPEGDPFVRVLAGADALPTDTTRLGGEVFYQSLGATDPADYLLVAADPRHVNGESWTLGRLYAGITGAWQASPLLSASAFAVVNLLDPSALVGPGLTWSPSAATSVGASLHAGLGRRPASPPTDGEALDVPIPRSEFGLVPTVALVTMQSWF